MSWIIDHNHHLSIHPSILPEHLGERAASEVSPWRLTNCLPERPAAANDADAASPSGLEVGRLSRPPPSSLLPCSQPNFPPTVQVTQIPSTSPLPPADLTPSTTTSLITHPKPCLPNLCKSFFPPAAASLHPSHHCPAIIRSHSLREIFHRLPALAAPERAVGHLESHGHRGYILMPLVEGVCCPAWRQTDVTAKFEGPVTH